MNLAEKRFIEELENSLPNCDNKQEIIQEYEMHLLEMASESECSDQPSYYEQIRDRLGSPQEIASMWRQETKLTPSKMQWLFVTFNICLFVGGGLLTFIYNFFHWGWIEAVWSRITDIPTIIIIVYFLFWGLLGYEIGKEFGSTGRNLLRKTFFYCVAPNLVLMALTVFRIIPHSWFQPLLNIPFIVACIVCTGFLYPVSWIGYKWGKRASV